MFKTYLSPLILLFHSDSLCLISALAVQIGRQIISYFNIGVTASDFIVKYWLSLNRQRHGKTRHGANPPHDMIMLIFLKTWADNINLSFPLKMATILCCSLGIVRAQASLRMRRLV